MGMDVFGTKPKNKQGEYFRANVWYWHPLWAMCEDLYPNLAGKVENGHVNSGDGLGHKDSLALSKLLKKDLESGKIAQYISDYDQTINSLEKVPCEYCDNTGYRNWNRDGLEVREVCNACKGELLVNHPATWYHMDHSLVEEFQVFLENCGGFSIC